MRGRLFSMLFVAAAAAALAQGPAAGGTAAWPHWLGPAHNGSAADPGAFSGRGPVRLEKAWSHPLETGQAGLAVAEGRVFTVYTDGTDDYAIALRADTGALAWRARLDPSLEKPFLPGPFATPAVSGDRVLTLSSACRLRAHDVASGQTRWEIDLKERFGASFPMMGCGSSPFVEDGRLYLQTGGKEQRFVALDAKTGEVSWTSRGGEPLVNASPAAAELLGVRQILAHHQAAEGKNGVTSLRLEDGAVLWSAELPAGFSFDTPLAFAGGGVVLGAANELHRLRVTRVADAWSAARLWTTADLGSFVSPPVFHAGHLFGFGGDHLACVDAETGATAWKEKLYPGSVILVDGHLVVLSTGAGLLRVAEATAAGYREKARLQVFNRGAQSWAPPSYAGRRVFVRGEDEVAAADVR